MPLAHHVIFTAYGFWLPNDPRGSCSDFVAAWELFLAGGKATRVTTRRSVACAPHDHAARLRVKEALHFPPVNFTSDQINTIATGFAKAITESGYTLYACSILPMHVHAVIRHHTRDIEDVISHLKQRASMALYHAHLHPFDGLKRPGGRSVSCWTERGWSVYLDTFDDIFRAVKYVRNNPLKDHRPAQHWDFITPFAIERR